MTAWDPEVLARMGRLELRARSLISGFLHGAHPSRRIASNIEFADYKPYTPGDPLRDLDWRVVARTDRLVVRRHHTEDELAVTLVVDASGDLETGSKGRYTQDSRRGSKWATASVLAATLAQWIGRRGDPVGLAILGGENVRWPWLPPRSGGAHLARIHGVLSELVPAGQARLAQGLLDVGRRVRRRSMVVVISDLMGTFIRPRPDALLAASRGTRGESQSLTVPLALCGTLILEISRKDQGHSLRSLESLNEARAAIRGRKRRTRKTPANDRGNT